MASLAWWFKAESVDSSRCWFVRMFSLVGSLLFCRDAWRPIRFWVTALQITWCGAVVGCCLDFARIVLCSIWWVFSCACCLWDVDCRSSRKKTLNNDYNNCSTKVFSKTTATMAATTMIYYSQQRVECIVITHQISFNFSKRAFNKSAAHLFDPYYEPLICCHARIVL